MKSIRERSRPVLLKTVSRLKKNTFIQILATIVFIAIMMVLVYFAFARFMPGLWEVLKSGEERDIEGYLRSQSDTMAYICMALLQAVQVISVVISGIPIQIAAGAVFGTIPGFILCHLTSVVILTVVFIVFRKMKPKAPVHEGERGKKQKAKLDFILKSEHPTYMTFIAFLVPFLPNGLIPHIAARTRITLKKFVLAAYFGSFLTILVFSAIGDNLLKGGYLTAGLLMVALCVVAVVLWKLKEKIQKKNIQKLQKNQEK